MATTSGELSEARYIVGTRLRSLRRWLLSRASWVVAQTQEAADELRDTLNLKRVAVLPNPVEIPPSPPLLTNRPSVLYAGRLSREKDLPSLLAAWRPIAAELPGARLTLAGEGGLFRSVEAELRREVKSDPLLRRSIALPGWVEDMEPLLAGNDVFVLPSLMEGMSNALLEACAWGRIVVASDIPANRAVVGDEYPLLFPAGDARALEGALRRALTSSEATRYDARQQVLRRAGAFSPDAVIVRLESMIDAADSPRHQHA